MTEQKRFKWFAVRAERIPPEPHLTSVLAGDNDPREEPRVTWSDVKNIVVSAPLAGGDLSKISEHAPKTPLQIMEQTPLDEGKVKVSLSCGTNILVTKTDIPTMFDFRGFANDNSTYKIPTHRFQKGKEDCKNILRRNQELYDAVVAKCPQDKRVIDTALCMLEKVGYAYPGISSSSNASVRCLYMGTDMQSEGVAVLPERVELFACVAIANAEGLEPVYVETRGRVKREFFEDDSKIPAILRALCWEALESYRADFLMPVVVNIVQ